MSEWVVYGHYDANNQCRYIGAGRIARAREFRFSQRSSGWAAVFAREKPRVEILFATDTLEEAVLVEHLLIREALQVGEPLVNILKGHHKLPESFDVGARAKLSAIKRANPTRYWLGKKRDPEFMQRLVVAAHTPEACAKRADALRGRAQSPEHVEARVAPLRGRPLTEEHRAAVSAGKVGKPNGLAGRVMPEEHRKKISEARRASATVKESGAKIWEARRRNGTAQGFTTKKARAVRCNETGTVYRCAKEAAAAAVQGSDKHIQACCTGRRPRHKDLSWSYA